MSPLAALGDLLDALEAQGIEFDSYEDFERFAEEESATGAELAPHMQKGNSDGHSNHA